MLFPSIDPLKTSPVYTHKHPVLHKSQYPSEKRGGVKEIITQKLTDLVPNSANIKDSTCLGSLFILKQTTNSMKETIHTVTPRELALDET